MTHGAWGGGGCRWYPDFPNKAHFNLSVKFSKLTWKFSWFRVVHEYRRENELRYGFSGNTYKTRFSLCIWYRQKAAICYSENLVCGIIHWTYMYCFGINISTFNFLTKNIDWWWTILYWTLLPFKKNTLKVEKFTFYLLTDLWHI